jgi:hypothetical protein
MSIDPGSIRFIEGRREVMFFIADIVGMNAVVGRKKMDFMRAILMKIRAYLRRERNKLALTFEERN